MGKTLLGGSESSSKPVDLTPPEVETLRGQFTGQLGNLITTPPAYTGPLTAGGPGAAETNILGQLAGGQGGPAGGQGSNLLSQTLSGSFLPGQPGANPFLDSAIQAAQRPTEDALNRTLSRTLPGTFTAAGQQIGGGLRSPNATLRPSSTAFDLAASNAFEGGARALSDIATNMSFAGYETERGRQQQGIQLGQQEVESMIKNLTAQALPRAIQDQGVERGMEQYNKDIAALLQALQTATATPLQTTGTKQKSESSTGLLPTLASMFSGRATGTSAAATGA